MTRRSASAAPVVARRLSLPFSRLPTLLPKPAKRANPTQINGPNGTINVHRINSQNIVLTPTASAAIKQGTIRPLPALNKVVTIANAAKPNATVVRRSMPPPSAVNSNNSSLNATISTPTLVPTKRLQVTRLPPTLKPAPQMKTTTIQRALPTIKTYTKNSDGHFIEAKMPIISKLKSIERTIGLEVTEKRASGVM